MAAIRKTKAINLALQGGGAHGAYTWGVLDRLLDEPSLRIEGISGTSAGAMNAAVLADGFQKDGHAGARKNLEFFWSEISRSAIASPMKLSFFEKWQHPWNLDHSWTYRFLDLLSRFFSPYELNPFDLNPMRDVLHRVLDVKRLHMCSTIKVFVSATRVSDGKPRLFRCDEITVDVLLASACLPFIYKAVTIEGEDYWDGGYVGNPVIWPLIYHCSCADMLLVQINPLHRQETPKTAAEILNRVNEITFNASLVAEMRSIHFVGELIRDNNLDRDKYKDVHMHIIERPKEMRDLNASSKLNAEWDFFLHLKALGQQAADNWIRRHYDDIGHRSTLDIKKSFLSEHHSREREQIAV